MTDIKEYVEDIEEVLKIEVLGKEDSGDVRSRWINRRGPVRTVEELREWLETIEHFFSPNNIAQAWEIYYELLDDIGYESR